MAGERLREPGKVFIEVDIGDGGSTAVFLVAKKLPDGNLQVIGHERASSDRPFCANAVSRRSRGGEAAGKDG
jgi:hypothetical protein